MEILRFTGKRSKGELLVKNGSYVSCSCAWSWHGSSYAADKLPFKFLRVTERSSWVESAAQRDFGNGEFIGEV